LTTKDTSSNLIINRLTDFGIAKKITEGLYSSDSICGTPAYISPEMLLK
jgi:serine/threonine protein kinase